MNKIILLTDYRNSFYSRMGLQENGFELCKLKDYFDKENYNLDILEFCDINFNEKALRGTPVLLHLRIRSFIIKILLKMLFSGLKWQEPG